MGRWADEAFGLHKVLMDEDAGFFTLVARLPRERNCGVGVVGGADG